METESSRRSAMDRPSRDLPKKPRLAAAAEPAEPPEPRRPTESSSSVSAALARGVQELVAQYRAALAELTFNSKPIITNLTIIAGENLHASKGIAAAICSNVLEVPSDQKLPSLYLLDSIVKNIGREYIKYFAARLPEVFCKAYKQVDSSIHNGMRHLFGTWKGVFPPSTLQIIEKELGFPTIINGSSGSAASKPDSQTQRQAHSIHVNPKYLEARQRLQQSTKAKEISSDDVSGVMSLPEDAERSDRNAITGSTKQWTDMPGRIPTIQRPQREELNNTRHEKKAGGDVKGHEFSSVLSRQPDLGVRRISEKITQRDELDKPYYGTESAASEAIAPRRNDFDAVNSYENYRSPGLAQPDSRTSFVQLNNTNKANRPIINWKNSEEEEFMWDDMRSKLNDYGRTDSAVKRGWNTANAEKPTNLKRGQWRPSGTEQPDFRQSKIDTFSRVKTSGGEDSVQLSRQDFSEHQSQPHSLKDTNSRRNMGSTTDTLSLERVASGHHTSSLWSQRGSLLSASDLNQMSRRVSGQPEGGNISFDGGLSTSLILSLPRTGYLSNPHSSSLGPTNTVSGSSGPFGQQRLQPSQPSSPPTARSPPPFISSPYPDHLQPPSLSQMVQKPVQISGNMGKHASVSQDSFSNSQPHILHNLQPPPLPSSQSSAHFTPVRHRPSLLHQSESDIPPNQVHTQPKPLIQPEKPPSLSQSSGTQGNNPVDISGKSSTIDLLASIMKSGVLSNNLSSGSPNVSIQPPLPSGPPPVQLLTSSAPLSAHSSTMLRTSQGNTPNVTTSHIGTALPPLPPGPPPPSSLVCSSSERPNKVGANPNPLSNLLSSLVAKGIISSQATELTAVTSSPMLHKIPEHSSKFSNSTSVVSSSVAATTTVPPASVTEHSVIIKPSASSGAAVLQPSVQELSGLIGIEFKSEIIRELHTSVIDNLFDDLNHGCDICGLRFKLQQQLRGHMDLHASKNSKLSNSDRSSRNWFKRTSNLAAGSLESPEMTATTTYLEELVPISEECRPMVPADETQSICTLCGEPFEDFYSHERDDWMYKGTLYLNSEHKEGDNGCMDESIEQLFIVHDECISSSADNMEVAS